MNASNKNNSDSQLASQHKEELGMSTPDGYFAESKAEILNSIKAQNNSSRNLFFLAPKYAYPIAASLVFLIGLLLWNNSFDSNSEIKISTNENLEELAAEDILISSLLVDDKELDLFVDHYFLNEVLLEAERSEQELDHLFLDSLFVNDSLIDEYVDKSLIEKVIL